MKRIKEVFPLLHKKTGKALWLLAFLFSFLTLQGQNVADFILEQQEANLFRVSMITNRTYSSPINNSIGGMQVSIKVKTGGFAIANLTSLIDSVQFVGNPLVIEPVSGFDYLTFSLQSLGTSKIPFIAGDTVSLFSFQNGGICSQDSFGLVRADDPIFGIPNSNVDLQLSVIGYYLDSLERDAPVGVQGADIMDCIDNTIATFSLDKLDNGSFMVSLTPRVTYDSPNNTLVSGQITLKVSTGGFDAGNIVDLTDGTFIQSSRSDNADFDYISFSLLNPDTDFRFRQDSTVRLFTFNNIGFCTDDTVSLLTLDDPFLLSNPQFTPQLRVVGFPDMDAPISIINNFAEDCTRDCYLGCNDNVQVSLGVNCIAEVRPEMIATAIDLTCPNGPKGIEIIENGVVIPTSPFLNESHIGRTFQVRVIDSVTTNSCWGSIIVNDKTAPIIGCEADTVSCVIQDISPDNPLIGYPSVSDNCSNEVPSLTYTDRQIRNGCGTDYSGRIERTWIATDSAGMVGSCVQDIYFRRQSMGMVVFPPNRDGVEGPIVTCTDGGTDPANVGSPTIDGDAIYPNIIGFCQLDAGYRDEMISFCAGNIQIVRTWTVVDACTGDHVTDIQIISVVDTTGPALLCPDTIFASVDNGACNATVTFPFAVAKDECSTASVRIETPFGNIEDNGGELSWIPVGYHEVTYIAIDECNNRSSCTTILHVEDRTSPVAACNFINDVSLRATGTVAVDASVFDDGSRDGCSGNQVTFRVQRVGDTLDFADFVTFYCTDAGDTLYVNVEVTDLVGNSDICVAAIVITNDTPPQITCPANQTINCTDDYSDLLAFGVPLILDDCGGTMNYTEQDSFEINSCGSGRIIRTFNVNHGGTVISCSQIITITNNSTFDGTIDWPDDYLTFACDNQPLDPASLPVGFDVPVYDSTGSCSRILVNFDDDEFDDGLTPVGCYKILRTWSIIDWCIFNPNDTAAGGYWSHVQTIDLVNLTAPTFDNCPTDLTVDITNSTCQAVVPLVMTATDDCTPTSGLRYTYAIDLNDDGTTDFNGTTNDATATYPEGIHRIRFTVSDDCGNTTACNFLFTVRDVRAPIASCSDGIFNIEDIGDELRAIINPRLLAINSTDNCTNFDDLIITANPADFGCNELGDNLVNITIIDEAGNSTTCPVTITITDTNNLCPVNRNEVNIRGIIINEVGERVNQVEVSINHPDVENSMTNQNGEFNLKDVPVGNDYTILPTRDFDVLNGISTFDLVLISRHILNIEPISSPYRLIAADVNRSKTITAYDIVQLRKLILRLSTDFPNNTSWRFIRTDFDFANPTNPNQSYFPEVYNINDLPTNDMEIEGFVAVKVGDVNGSARTQVDFTEGESRNATNTLKIQTPNQALEVGTVVEVPFKMADINQLLGFQFAINFDPNSLELIELIPNKETALTVNNFGLNFLERGLITTSWEQPVLKSNPITPSDIFTLRFKVKAAKKLSEVLSLHSSFMKGEAYKVTDASLELLDIALLFENNSTNKTFQLYQNKPNPFSKQTIIGFEVSDLEIVTLNIIDITGKMIQQIQYDALKGYNEITINDKDIEGKGVYYYQLATSSGIATKKMIVVD